MSKFYDVEDRLVAVQGDAAAVWQSEAGEWKVLGVPMARKALLDGERLTDAQAATRFPNADLTTLPLLRDTAEPADRPELATALDAMEQTIDEVE